MSFNIVFNSNDGAGTNLFDLEYTFDFSFMEDCEYELNFTFVSETQPENDFANIDKKAFAISIPNFPLKNVFIANNKMRNQTCNVLGLVIGEPMLFTNTYAFQYKSHPSNTPVICMKPSNNVFRVQLLDYEGDLLTEFEHYNLILNFKKVKQYI